MATETQTGLSGHVRGVTVTTLACLAGVAASLAAVAVVGTSPEAASDTRSLAFLVAAVAGQYPLLKAVGVDVSDFGAKDHLYVAFMTFTLWFISFAILLTTGATL
jgi:P pilus assembly chaperone PapD